MIIHWAVPVTQPECLHSTQNLSFSCMTFSYDTHGSIQMFYFNVNALNYDKYPVAGDWASDY